MEDSLRSAQSNLALPASFKPYDTQEIFGLSFPRKIQPSAWATKHRLAGRKLEDIKFHELSWQGWQDYNLRALAHVSINFTRSSKEATFISYFLQHFFIAVGHHRPVGDSKSYGHAESPMTKSACFAPPPKALT